MVGVGRAAVAFAALAALYAHEARAAAPRAVIEGEMDADLRQAIGRAVGETDKPIANRFEARRRAREAGENAILVLRSEGYYAHEVEPDVGEGEPPRPVVKVTPGPRFGIAEPKVEWIAPEPIPEVRQAGEAVMGLANGQPGRAADVIGAEGRIVAAVQKRGYADVVAGTREVIVDHADQTVRPTFKINSGDLVRLDGIDLVTEGRTNPAWLRQLAPWREGEVYDPEDVGELERRLLDTGVYDSVAIALAPKEKTTAEGRRPVLVSLADRRPRTLELGASYSTSEGAGVEARWTHYNRLRRADTLSLLGRASELDSRIEAQAILPHWRRPQHKLTAAAAAYNIRTDAYDEKGVGVRADVERRFGKTSYLTLGGSLDYSQTDELQIQNLTPLGSDLITVAGLAVMSLDRSDDPLNPRRGWRIEARGEPTYIAGDENLPYLKVTSLGSVYIPFGAQAQTVIAMRAKAGAMINGSASKVPASRRFYSGGGGSVRGYAYQAIGPRRSDNTPQGGGSVIEASVELRQKITGRWGGVVFIDGGAVGDDQFPSGDDFSAGVGIGVRYDLGFGPIRADIAIPLDKREGDAAFQIYLSIGQAF
jgi:translocation and assembly module TamA